MIELTLALLAVAGVLTIIDWRHGLLLCVVVGVAQDPLRKLAPGQPVYYVVLVGVIFMISWARAAVAKVPLGPSVIKGWRKHLGVPFALFMALVAAQALHSYVSYGSAMLVGIGMLVWLAPVPAIVLAYQYATRRGLLGVRRWLQIYVVAAVAALSGVYLEYLGFGWSTLGEIGEGQLIYDVGTVLKAHSGFFRASEIAAWHTAAIACFVFILSLGRRATLLRVGGALLFIIVLVSLGILTGRRKLLVEITIFLCTYGFLVALLQKGMARLAMLLLAVGIVSYITIVGFLAPDLVQTSRSRTLPIENAQRIEGYAVRGQSVFADVPARVNAVGVQPVLYALENFGWMGAGLGTGSQGTSDIFQGRDINRWAAEGGLGKVSMELGLPGLVLVGWLIVALARHLRQQLAAVALASPQHTRMAFGLVAFLVANAATFSVAAQAFSDLFVLLILGLCLGFLLAMPTLAARGDGVRKPRRAPPWMAAASTVQGRFAPQPGSMPGYGEKILR